MTGITSRASMASSMPIVPGRTPEAPRPRLASFNAIIKRTCAATHRLADAGGMGEHDVALERREVAGRDVHAGELAEAGIDAVDRLAASDDGVDRACARLDRRHGGGIEPDVGAFQNGAPVGERGASRRQRDRAHAPLRTRACSGLNPMR